MQLASNIQLQCRDLSLDAFIFRYPHPWMVRELSSPERSALSRPDPTVLLGPSYYTSPLISHADLFEQRMAVRLAREHYRFALLPVAKSRGNLWHNRVLIGRASSNDLVLADDSVSKLHAYLRRDGLGWQIHDAGSTNGTIVDGRRVDPDGASVPLRSGAVLHLGRERCEFITGEELYNVLSTSHAASLVAM
jgi:hypothetical protein